MSKLIVKSLFYRFIAKLPIPRGTPFIGEWANSIRFRVYMSKNGAMIGELVAKLSNEVLDMTQKIVNNLEENGDSTDHKKAQEMKGLINKGRGLANKIHPIESK